jgi:hypothetical protein
VVVDDGSDFGVGTVDCNQGSLQLHLLDQDGMLFRVLKDVLIACICLIRDGETRLGEPNV